ncbi:MAG: hypothetical protein J6M64_00820 [Oscillospiraceae bacterium]|nr:hypothetical protein [Oscillospiraceae bacterium]
MEDEHMNDFEDEEVDLDSDEAEYLEMIESWEDDKDDGNDSIPELYFSRPDPYAEHAMRQDDQRSRNYRVDEQGRIVVRNLSAWWIPEMKILEEIDGTLYTVTGSYEGTELLDQKLTRIMLRNLEDF